MEFDGGAFSLSARTQRRASLCQSASWRALQFISRIDCVFQFGARLSFSPNPQRIVRRTSQRRFQCCAWCARDSRVFGFFARRRFGAGVCLQRGECGSVGFFMARFRPELYHAGRAIAGEAAGRELADSLYAELYGLREVEGQRKSLFDYFLGRSKLTTWLHAILAQRHVDGLRRPRRTEPLEAGDTGEQAYAAHQSSVGNASATSFATSLVSSAVSSPDPDRNRYLAILQAALTSALDALQPHDRLRLAFYY